MGVRLAGEWTAWGLARKAHTKKIWRSLIGHDVQEMRRNPGLSVDFLKSIQIIPPGVVRCSPAEYKWARARLRLIKSSRGECMVGKKLPER